MTLELKITDNYPAYKYFQNEGDLLTVKFTDEIPESEMQSLYFEAGSHPDIVAHVWNEISPNLPVDGACTINGKPAIIIPKTGVLLAVCMGTAYVVRITGDDRKVAIKENYHTSQNWSGSYQTTKLDKIFGEEWFFGSYSDNEIGWLLNTYNKYSK